MSNVVIYTTQYCGFCVRAKQLLETKSVSYKEVKVDGDPEARRKLAEASGQRTVPQIWIGDNHVGGCTELMALEYGGGLDTMLGR